MFRRKPPPSSPNEMAKEAANSIVSSTNIEHHEIAIVLGSGWANGTSNPLPDCHPGCPRIHHGHRRKTAGRKCWQTPKKLAAPNVIAIPRSVGQLLCARNGAGVRNIPRMGFEPAISPVGHNGLSKLVTANRTPTACGEETSDLGNHR